MTPRLTRIRMVTTAAPDLDAIVDLYSRWLDFKVRETGVVDPDLARSWDAPAAAGRRFSMLSSDGDPDVFVRFVETDPVPDYRPISTYGWNSWEIIVDDPYKLHEERLIPSPFTVIGEPHPLQTLITIHATQVVGPAQEVLYLTAEMGDRAKSILPEPKAFVGRPFILVIGGPDIEALLRWYGDKFGMSHGPVADRRVKRVTWGLGLPDDTPVPLTTGKLAQHGNLIEFDGYPSGGKNFAGERKRSPGQLPPGNAMATFGVANLDELDLEWITPPRGYSGAGYDGRRAATTRGPVGELIELLEE